MMKNIFSNKTVEALKNNQIVVMPTDTIYGICASAFSKCAVEKIYELKDRDKNKPFIILIGSIPDLEKFNIKVDPKTEKLLKKYWPGKYSIILSCREEKFKYLHRGTKTLSFRLPDDKEISELIKKTGPIATSSANLQGRKSAQTIDEAKAYFGNHIDLYIDGGKLVSSPSTILEFKNDGIIVRRIGEINLPKNYENKILAIYKPKGPTSYDVIAALKKQTGIRKIGHAGTLDPLAKGVLVVAIGREATKKLNELVKKEKEYLATIKFGQISETDDEEGAKTNIKIKNIPDLEKIQQALFGFIGQIKQTPPKYSALKVAGKPLYKYARRGQEVEIKSRLVLIKSIRIAEYKWPYLKLKVITGSGAYIRALARDLGEKLKVGGYLADLERTRVGNFTKEKAVKIIG